MPSAHRNALKKLLESINQRIDEDDVRMLKATTDEERTKLVEELADLHLRRAEIMDALSGDGDSQ